MVSWVVAYVLPSGPVKVRVLPLVPVVRVIAQLAAWFPGSASVSLQEVP
jgi:hypothetical protein